MKTLRIGYLPLSDALPLLVAREFDFFERYGLDVTLCSDVSWANIRDKLIVGQLDCSQLLAPMLLASTLGLGGLRKPLVTAWSMGLNGNSITVSTAAAEAIGTPRSLDATVQWIRKSDRAPIFATVFPWSCHTLQLRYWLASGGIDPDNDIETMVLPPSQLADHMSMGHIDGFIAGAPWNRVAEARGVGTTLIDCAQIWSGAPEKVLAATSEWVETHRDEHLALLNAMYDAGVWLQENPGEGVALLQASLPVAPELLSADALPQSMHFNAHLANYPWPIHAHFLLSEMRRWGWVAADVDISGITRQCYREDIFREAMAAKALPSEPRTALGLHASPWSIATSQGGIDMTPDALCDGKHFVAMDH